MIRQLSVLTHNLWLRVVKLTSVTSLSPSVETGRHVSAYTLDSDGLHVIDHYKAIRFQEETNILDRPQRLVRIDKLY